VRVFECRATVPQRKERHVQRISRPWRQPDLQKKWRRRESNPRTVPAGFAPFAARLPAFVEAQSTPAPFRPSFCSAPASLRIFDAEPADLVEAISPRSALRAKREPFDLGAPDRAT
jgi:hypothetical protein